MAAGPHRIAIVGAGVIGAVHARLIDHLPEKATLAAVVDTDHAAAEELAGRYGARAFTSAAQAYENAGIDVAAICTPSAYHADGAIEALEHGCHVIVEKPIDITLAAADRLIAAEQATGRSVSVISQRRFQPVAAAIKTAIETGQLGRLTSATVESPLFRPQSYYDSGDWRGTQAIDGGGALMNQGIHMLDLLLWYLGDPVRVSAHSGQLAHAGIEVEDVAAATITFESGAIATILTSTAAYPGMPTRISVYGDRGTAIMNNDQLAVFSTAEHAAPPADQLKVTDTIEGWAATELAHRDQYAEVLDAIDAGRTPAITTTDGRRALQTVLAIYESARRSAPVRPAELERTAHARA